jgi:hypothetical protein
LPKHLADVTQAKPWVTNWGRINKLPRSITPNEHLMNNPAQNLPGWGEMPKRPGLYLSLTHGRDFPQQYVKARGFAGPKIGPLLYVQTLYAQQVTLRFANAREAKRFFPETTLTINSLEVIEGTLVYAGKCYGNWDVCYIPHEFCDRSRI